MKRLCYGIVAGGAVSAGEVEKLRKKEQNIVWIAADSGAEVLWQNSVIPHLLIGDLDSLPEKTLRAIKSKGQTEIFRFLPEKDMSDTYLALQAARLLQTGGIKALFAAWRDCHQPAASAELEQLMKKAGSHKPQVVLLGAVGSRLDHSLSNLWILFDFIPEMELTVWTATSRIRAYSGQKELHFKRKINYPFFSILPLSEKLEGLSLKGFRYPLNNQTITQNQASWLLSNQLTGKSATLKVRRGKFLVIRSRD